MMAAVLNVPVSQHEIFLEVARGLRSVDQLALVVVPVAHARLRISPVRTDRGHEFQARSPWHVEDQGIWHVYIKPQTPQLNGNGEHSHRTDQTEFYQLLTYTDDVDVNVKLKAWENFYNYDRHHIFFEGKTP